VADLVASDPPRRRLPDDALAPITVRDSTPDFPKGVEAPAGAPNVLLILTDDVGLGASSTFGGPIQTPNFQRPVRFPETK
jgi:arylsulfatase